MKLKEAQMLGVLALIAVGIILLCMWGGEGDSAAPPPDRPQAQASDQPALEPDLAELYNELLGSKPTAADSPRATTTTASMSIGGQTTTPAPAASESSTLNSLIDSVTSAQIPLTGPAAATETPSAAAPAPKRTITHVVSAGETLSAISQKYYGTSGNWKLILDANSSVLKDPRYLKPNMRLVIPASASSAVSASAPAVEKASVLSATATRPGASVRTYTVAKGDTLFRIAMKYYGDGSRYRDVLAANRRLVSKPQDLRPGMELVIP